MKHPIFTVLIENWKPMKESVQHPTTEASRLFRITWMAHLIFSALTHLIPLSLATPSLPAMPRTLREMWPHAISWSPFEVRYSFHFRYVETGKRRSDRTCFNEYMMNYKNHQDNYVKSNKQCQCVHGNGRPSGLITEMNLFRCFYCLQCFHVKKKEGKKKIQS